ncbi:hypothetical protein CBR_g19435 [Chara braunii]|uniref:Uncharacterized protein n=1 Tax=Chara braunii TaxID=69332 RepID=A0A388KY04_CHABU|nr:hypothetical protein CBR_g19435 [Chara braunii]|eukprot:GBG74921.1 hypothetical protein CBR_g19435 [Chara braunii]
MDANVVKFRKYHRDFIHMLNNRYFSGKNLAESGYVFESTAVSSNLVIRESLEHPLKVFLQTPELCQDMLIYQSDQCSGGPSMPRESRLQPSGFKS